MCQNDTYEGLAMTTSSPRITARVSLDTQELLSKAAALSGISSINSFVLSAAIEKANKIMEREETLKLSKRDAMLLLEALDRPAKANKKLSEAFKAYEEKKL
ncbi:MAG: Unknown protein [uncultured Sulfurovum sp.]|uniref:DUF1778 domain-containing protein n=1 Tax=uncultured Sulfurovum sp. TaxID=269237 RepID=A0A6S6T9X2_9BACT|nr:MAG: Unknown protein [uncultured Sulfurovum sp.]